MRFRDLAIFFSVCCSVLSHATIPGGPSPAPVLPDQPSIMRNVANIQTAIVDAEEIGSFTRNYIPSLRTTNDGFIGISMATTPVISGKKYVRLFLLSPEKLVNSMAAATPSASSLEQLALPASGQAPYIFAAEQDLVSPSTNVAFFDSVGGGVQTRAAELWQVPAEININAAMINAGSNSEIENLAICQDNQNMPVSASGVRDVYTFNIITATKETDGSVRKLKLWKRPITVTVSNPKSADPQITAISFGTATSATTSFIGHSFSEPTFSRDGRLLVFRTTYAGFPVNQTTGTGNPDSCAYSDTGTTSANCPYIDLVYSYSSSACDINGFDQIKPVSSAYYDSRINDTSAVGDAHYGFAEYPMRAPDGQLYVNKENVPGVYPWIDMDGDNLFFTTIKSTLYGGFGGNAYTKGRFVTGCVSGYTCDVGASDPGPQEEVSQTRGIAVAGLWTKGKTVLLDGVLNSIDYGMDATLKEHRTAELYVDAAAAPVSVRLGSGRDSKADGTLISADYKYHPRGSLINTAFLGSVENLWNYYPPLRPVTPADVVWRVSSGSVSDEVVFDDYLNTDAIIVSSMVGLLGKPPASHPQAYYAYYDGFMSGAYLAPDAYNWSALQLSADAVRVQNAATSYATHGALPAYGQVFDTAATDNVRVEPVALGGVHGKGLWLSGTSGISYDMAGVTGIGSSWYVSLFVDFRGSVDTFQKILGFADGSYIEYKRATGGATGTIQYRAANFAIQDAISFPVVDGWLHLAIQVKNSGDTVDLYKDGYLVDTWVRSGSQQPLFKIDGGPNYTLIVGNRAVGAPNGFKGWIDDFKVFAGTVNPEVACNHALGTLIGIDSAATGAGDDSGPAGVSTWGAIAATYPASTHSAIRNLLGSNGKKHYPQFACYHDYSDDYQAHLGNIPLNANGETASVRSAVLMPEAPLFADIPRPDFFANQFCLGCHTGTVSGDPLSTHALSYLPGTPAKSDARRQPMQYPPILRGCVAGFGCVETLWCYDASVGGCWIDDIVLTLSDDDDDGDTLKNAGVVTDNNAEVVTDDEGNQTRRSDTQHVDTDGDGTADDTDNHPLDETLN